MGFQSKPTGAPDETGPTPNVIGYSRTSTVENLTCRLFLSGFFLCDDDDDDEWLADLMAERGIADDADNGDAGADG